MTKNETKIPPSSGLQAVAKGAESHGYDTEIELTSYTQNVAKVNSFVLQLEREFNKGTIGDRSNALFKELNSLVIEIQAQTRRALTVGGPENPIYLELASAMDRLDAAAAKAESIVNVQKVPLRWVKEKSRALDSLKLREFVYDPRYDRKIPENQYLNTTEFNFLNDLACRLINGEGEDVEGRSSLVHDLAESITHKELMTLASSPAPPSGPIDKANDDVDDGNMEMRIDQLEKDISTVKMDVAVIRSNYSKGIDLERAKTELTTSIGAVKAELKTEIASLRTELKVDIKGVETTMTRWMIGIVLSLVIGFDGTIFAATNFVKNLAPVSSVAPQVEKTQTPHVK